MKDARKISETDLWLVADYFDLTLSYNPHFQLVKEVEYDMNMKIKELLYVTL